MIVQVAIALERMYYNLEGVMTTIQIGKTMLIASLTTNLPRKQTNPSKTKPCEL